MSLLPATSHANPTTQFFSPMTSGKFLVAAGTTQTIPIAGMTANGLVLPVYVHPNGGGAGQFIQSVTPGTNQVVIVLGVTAAVPEYILWHALKF